MAAQDRRKAFDIERSMLDTPGRYTFVQAMRLLRLLLNDRSGKTISHTVRVRPDLAWNTPPEEISRVEWTGDQVLRITATFLGLYGATSPLPMFYTQELDRERNQNGSASREFIDIVNGVLYDLYYRIWERSRLYYGMFESPDKRLWERLFSLAGLGCASRREGLSDPQAQVCFAGVVSRPIRTAEGLRAILCSVFGRMPIEVEQCVERTATIPAEQRFRLGLSGNRLGHDSIVGSKLMDRMGAVRLHVGPVAAFEFNDWLPGTVLMTRFREQVRLYMDQPLAWDVQVSCLTDGLRTVRLGRGRPVLGMNTWIFSGRIPAARVATRFSSRVGSRAG